MVRNIVKVCPKAEELSEVVCNVPCPVNGCDKILPHTGCLLIHLKKTHKIIQDEPSAASGTQVHDPLTVFQYHCPVDNCRYNSRAERYFSCKKLLKQHYLKVHNKKFQCFKCDQKFGFENSCRKHEIRCGLVYRCKSCDCPYATVEAMLTHCSRKQHEPPDDCLSQKAKERKKEKMVAAHKQSLPATSTVPSTGQNIFLINMIMPSMVEKQPAHPKLKPIQPKPVIHSTIPLTVVNVLPDKIYLTHKERPIDDSHNKPFLLCSPVAEMNGKRLDNVNKSTTSIQTHVSLPMRKRIPRTIIAETQTDILQAAMTKAKLPTRRISRGSQVSPRVQSARYRNTQSTHTQTSEARQLRKKRRSCRKKLLSDMTSQCSLPEMLSGVQSLESVTPLTYSDRTSTLDLLDLMANTSTQTHNSFLSSSQSSFTVDANSISLANQQSTETQTLCLRDFEETAKELNEILSQAISKQTPFASQEPQRMVLSPLSIEQNGEDIGRFSKAVPEKHISVTLYERPTVDTANNANPCNNLNEQGLDLNNYSQFVPVSECLDNSYQTDSRRITGLNDTIEKPPFMGASSVCLSQLGMGSIAAPEMHSRLGAIDPTVNPSGMADSQVQTSMTVDDLDAMFSSASSMETQTMDMLDLFMNNMETQTSEEVLFSGISSNETQTTMDVTEQTDEQNSAETQTSWQSLSIEQSDMETQTAFPLLDFVLTESHTQTSFSDLQSLLDGWNM